MSRRKRPRLTPPPQPMMTATEANDLAADLIAELTEHAGDPDAVGATLTRWLDRLDVRSLGFVCMAGVQQVFADRLTRVPLDAMPAGALNLTTPTTEGITHD